MTNLTNYWTAICLDCEEKFDGFHETCPACNSALTKWACEYK